MEKKSKEYFNQNVNRKKSNPIVCPPFLPIFEQARACMKKKESWREEIQL